MKNQATQPALLEREEGMGSPVLETHQKVANFQIRRLDTSLFSTVEGLMTLAGVGRYWLRGLIVKEVTDNALDEVDRFGGSVTVAKDGEDTYIVSDEGRGMSQNPEELCDKFSASRAR